MKNNQSLLKMPSMNEILHGEFNVQENKIQKAPSQRRNLVYIFLIIGIGLATSFGFYLVHEKGNSMSTDIANAVSDHEEHKSNVNQELIDIKQLVKALNKEILELKGEMAILKHNNKHLRSLVDTENIELNSTFVKKLNEFNATQEKFKSEITKQLDVMYTENSEVQNIVTAQKTAATKSLQEITHLKSVVNTLIADHETIKAHSEEIHKVASDHNSVLEELKNKTEQYRIHLEALVQNISGIVEKIDWVRNETSERFDKLSVQVDNSTVHLNLQQMEFADQIFSMDQEIRKSFYDQVRVDQISDHHSLRVFL